MQSRFSFTLLLSLFATLNVLGQQAKPIYNTETLKIEQISPNTFVHISYLQTNDFGKVGCNGMIVINGGEALVFDTPTDSETSLELINWLEEEQGLKVKGVVATHFHVDCVGGLNEFHVKSVPSYASFKTIELAKAASNPVPEIGFEDKLVLKVGQLEVINQYFGEGHTRDNVVAYVSSDHVLFGGCMIKEQGAGVGFLGDANVSMWPNTVASVRSTFPEIKLVIPGHGNVGGQELFDYTIELFSKK